MLGTLIAYRPHQEYRGSRVADLTMIGDDGKGVVAGCGLKENEAKPGRYGWPNDRPNNPPDNPDNLPRVLPLYADIYAAHQNFRLLAGVRFLLPCVAAYPMLYIIQP